LVNRYKQNKEQGDLLFLLAEVRRDMNHFAGMDSALNQLSSRSPERYEEITLFRKQAYSRELDKGFKSLRLREWNDAETHFQNAVFAWRDGDAAYALMVAHQMNGHPKLAWKTAKTLSGSKMDRYRVQADLAFLNRDGAELVQAGQGLSGVKSDMGRDWEAMGHLFLGEPQTAIKLWQPLLNETKDSAEADRYTYNLACAYFQDQQFARTVELLSDQNSDDALHLKGLAFLGEGKWPQALHFFSQVANDSTSIKQFRDPLEIMVTD